MKKFASGLLAATLAASFSAAAFVPAGAMPLPLVPSQASTAAPDAAANFETVEYKEWWRHRDRRGRDEWRHGRDRGPYWRGHRGERHWRPGYRRHGDFWFPLAAFATGAIIAGAIANDAPPAYRGSSAHVRWCYERYRSYRSWDNTFQPYNGPRRQCVSPY